MNNFKLQRTNPYNGLKAKLSNIAKVIKTKVIVPIVIGGFVMVSLLAGCAQDDAEKVTATPAPSATAAPVETPEIENIEEKANVEYRIEIMTKIQSFLSEINGDKAVTVDGQKIMYTWNEAVALYIYFNDLSEVDMYNLFGNYDGVDFDNIKNDYENAMLKLRLYFVKAKDLSNVSFLIDDEESKVFFQKYEQAHIEYNKIPFMDRVDDAEAIFKMYMEDYIDGSNLQYEDVQPGVARVIITVFIDGDQIGWRNSEFSIPADFMAIINMLEDSSCQRTNESIENSVQDFEAMQTEMFDEPNVEEPSTSYETLAAEYQKTLPEVVDTPVDANNIDFFDNYNGVQKTSGSILVPGSYTGSKGGKTETTVVVDQGTIDAGDIDEFIDNLPPELQDDAQEQVDDINDDIADENLKQEQYGQGLTAGYAASYDKAFNAGEAGASKPAGKSVPSEVGYDKGYAEGYNRGIQCGYADGKAALEAKQAAEETADQITPPESTATPEAIVTPEATIAPVKMSLLQEKVLLYTVDAYLRGLDQTREIEAKGKVLTKC
ncbi:MAG: hypothetical protein PHQ89_02050 [Bacilli bacterium]|nr:hypothetical protein [Bacilli bacterium]